MCKGFYLGIVKIGSVLGDLLLLLLRLYYGFGFFKEGYGKLIDIPGTAQFFSSLGIPLSTFNAYLVGGVECLGGLLLIVGLFSRITTVPLIIVMSVAYLTAHHEGLVQIFSKPEVFIKQPPFLYLLTCLIVFSFGPGKISLDYLMCLIFRKKESCPMDSSKKP